MTSDLSSGCTDDIEIFDEKEEGEISLDDVSSSEESQPHYRTGYRSGGQCRNCMSLQQCASWCIAAKTMHRSGHRKQVVPSYSGFKPNTPSVPHCSNQVEVHFLPQDAVHGKENRRHIKESGSTVSKHMVSTLQEKNDDLVPISSDSDMEIVGLAGNSKQTAVSSSATNTKVRKRKTKKRSRSKVLRVDDLIMPEIDTYLITESIPKTKSVHSSRAHHRELSPPQRKVRSSLIKAQARSPSRKYRAPQLRPRSPCRRSISPASRMILTEKKLPRKCRSPRRSPPRSPVRFGPPKSPRDSSLSQQTCIDMYGNVTKLLKKVRHLESVGTCSPKENVSRNKEHSSLKEKLSNIMKDRSEPSHEKRNVRNRGNTNVTNGKSAVAVETPDDDEDIELLRRLALETKQKKLENKNEETAKTVAESTNAEANLSDDNDSEALELRMIALHSAVMKKHKDRVQRGVKSKRQLKPETRVESPFSQSFLDAIPIPGEVEPEVTTPTTKSPIPADSNHPEDMDLDTDVELEKEKDSQPYSPTDDLTKQIAELPSVEPHSGKPVIPLNHQFVFPQSHKPADTTNTVERHTTPTVSDYSTPKSLSYYPACVDALYSPSDPTETPKTDKILSTPIERSPYAKNTINETETPYSPTDTPIYDPDLPTLPPEVSTSTTLPNDPHLLKSMLARDNEWTESSKENSVWKVGGSNLSAVRNLTSTMLDLSITEVDIDLMNNTSVDLPLIPLKENTSESSSLIAAVGSALSSSECSISSVNSIRMIDQLPEIDLDGSPLVPVPQELEAAEVVIPLEISREIVKIASEPSYLQGLPDVTKDTNKIPTLVNRTLVPAPILKTNKQLQQPMPQKKLENHVEPTFKSAEMRPVNVKDVPVKSFAHFKPIKLCPISKKAQVVTSTKAAISASFGDELADETKHDDELLEKSEPVKQPSIRISNNVTSVVPPVQEKPQENDEPMPSGKKVKKRNRYSRKKRRSSSARVDSPYPVRERESLGSKTKIGESNSNNSTLNRQAATIDTDYTTSEILKNGSNYSTFQPTENSKDANINSNHSTQNKLSSSKSDKTNTRSKVEGTLSKSSSEKKRSIKKSKRAARRYLKKHLSPDTNKDKQTMKSVVNKSHLEINEDSNKNTNRSSTGEGSSSDLSKKQSAEPDIAKSTDEKLNLTSDNSSNAQTHDKKDPDKTEEQLQKTAEAERKRRCSLDEDEETLRALLLASLPKRTKPAEGSSSISTNTLPRLPQLSDTTTTNTSAENSTSKVATAATASLSDSVFTPGKPLVLSSQSSSSNSVPQSRIDVPNVVSENPVARKIFTSTSNSSENCSPVSPRKRINTAPVKGPPKKIVKKALPVLASTKVVNNAKKYQNTMLQKKLNLQKAASIYSAQNGSRNITLNNLKTSVATRPSSPKISTASKMQRLVINLGSDTDSESEVTNQPSNPTITDTIPETRKPLTIPTTDFEKSVVQFLKDQRKKLESGAAVKATTNSTTTPAAKTPGPSTSSGKISGLYVTPLAVRRHLPVSKQEEYRRLKQQIQILELEKLKSQKAAGNGSALHNPNTKSPTTPPGPLSPPVAAAIIQKQNQNDVKSNVSSQILTTTLANPVIAPSKDNSENVVAQQKISIPKIDENRTTLNIAKVPKTMPTTILNKQMTYPIASSIVNSNIPNISSIPTKTSTPKVIEKTNTLPDGIQNVSSSISLTRLKKSVVAITNTRSHCDASEKSSASPQIIAQPFTNVPVCDQNLSGPCTMSRPYVSTAKILNPSATNRCSLNTTEMLIIQIPNDKVHTDKLPSEVNSNSESVANSTNSKTAPVMLRILTKEQLNNRSLQIQVKHGPAARRVTIGPMNDLNDISQLDDLPTSKVLLEGTDKIDETIPCDNSLIVNESTQSNIAKICTNDAQSSSSNMIVDSDASTVILPRNRKTYDNNATADSGTSTIILAQDNSMSREKLRITSPNDCTTVQATLKAVGTKQTKVQVKEIWDKIRSDVKAELEMFEELSLNEQKKMLLESQEKLVAKRNLVLEDLTEMSGCLRQWEMEREMQTKLIAEVRVLREQLRIAEERLYEQRRQMNGMGPKVTKAHEKINRGRRECYKLSRICHGLGTKIIGEGYKVPRSGAQLLNDRLKEVAIHTRQLSKKKVPLIGLLGNSRDSSPSSSSTTSEMMSDNYLTEKSSNVQLSFENVTDNDQSLNSPMGETDHDERTREHSDFPELTILQIDEPTNNQNDEQRIEISASNHIFDRVQDDLAKKNEVKSSTDTDRNETSVEVENIETNVPTNLIPCTSIACNKDRIDKTPVAGTSGVDSSAVESLTKTSSATKKIDPYKSVLTHFRIPRNVNPNGILCPYELMGTCNDAECQFYHLDPDHWQ